MKWLLSKPLKFTKNQKGLTLVELLAVIVILGIIAAIAVPSIGGIISNSKTNADVQTETLIKDAAERYLGAIDVDGDFKVDSSSAALTTITGITGTSAAAVVTMGALETAGYLKSIPKKQSASTAYTSVTLAYTAAKGWTASTVAAVAS